MILGELPPLWFLFSNECLRELGVCQPLVCEEHQ
jgi:hypothetical protein